MTKDNNYEEVVELADWGYYDQLDHKTIEPDEKLELLFTDGTTLEVFAIVKQRTERVNAGYCHEDIGYSHAYAKIPIHGMDIEIPLKGSGIKARRV